MNLVKLTPENASQYVGYNILFNTPKTSDTYIVRKIIRLTSKTVIIDYPKLNNSLTLDRKIHVIIE
jgi:hypothetical protein